MIQQIMNMIRKIGPSVPNNSHITDNIFIYIENTPGSLAQYRGLCHAYGSWRVNMGIGKQIRQMYGLQNTGRSKANIKLIKTYTRH